MKTKIFFISLFMIAGFAISNANAQNKDTKSVQEWVQSTYWSPVYCGGVQVDVLSGGEIMVHKITHYKDGVYQWQNAQIKGQVTSDLTGEVFKIQEVDKTYFTDHWYVTWHYNLKGNLGTHYIGTLTYSYWTGEITVGKTVCIN